MRKKNKNLLKGSKFDAQLENLNYKNKEDRLKVQKEKGENHEEKIK